jgi:2-oxoglutarate ferredoxin oxidoreductase subunit delta
VTAADVVVSRGTLVIDVEACKGCDLCIDACPPGVLVMTTHQVNTRGYRYPELLPGCTGCKACSQVCPDFVFQVYKYDTPVRTEVVDPTGRDGDRERTPRGGP